MQTLTANKKGAEAISIAPAPPAMSADPIGPG